MATRVSGPVPNDLVTFSKRTNSLSDPAPEVFAGSGLDAAAAASAPGGVCGCASFMLEDLTKSRTGTEKTGDCPCARVDRMRRRWSQSPPPPQNTGPCGRGDKKHPANNPAPFQRWPKPQPG